MREIFRSQRMWRPRQALKRRYSVVVIGGGSHGLATAYYLARNHGITDVAVLEQSYIGSGASGRNTTQHKGRSSQRWSGTAITAASKTAGSTIPQPPSSTQPVREQVRHPSPRQIVQVTSNSADGSVNGK